MASAVEGLVGAQSELFAAQAAEEVREWAAAPALEGHARGLPTMSARQAAFLLDGASEALRLGRERWRMPAACASGQETFLGAVTEVLARAAGLEQIS